MGHLSFECFFLVPSCSLFVSLSLSTQKLWVCVKNVREREQMRNQTKIKVNLTTSPPTSKIRSVAPTF